MTTTLTADGCVLRPMSIQLRPYILDVLKDGKWHAKTDIVFTVLAKSGVRSTPEITRVISGLMNSKMIERRERGREISYRLARGRP